MKNYKVRIWKRAQDAYIEADTWWQRYRAASPDLLSTEFRAASRFISENPEARQVDDKHKDIRHILLPRTRYYVFYRVHHELGEVHIIGFRHASRLPPEEFPLRDLLPDELEDPTDPG